MNDTVKTIFGLIGGRFSYGCASEQFGNNRYGNWFCKCRAYDSAAGNIRYFWC